MDWADDHEVLWAFSDRNAGTRFTDFYNSREDLDKIDWNAVRSTDFRDFQVKEGKQAEFLLHDTFPWQLVEKIGVIDAKVRNRVDAVLQNANHKPIVNVERSWYY